MGFSSYADLLTKYNGGQRYLRPFIKSISVNGTGWYTAWPQISDPVAGGYSGTSLNAQQTLETTAGAIDHGGNVSALTKHLLRWNHHWASINATHYVMLVDRLLYYPGISGTSTANQALVNGVTLPRYTGGIGVRAWLEAQGNQPVGFVIPPVFTFGDSGYTNSAGATGRQHGVTVNCTASATAGAPFIVHSSVSTANRQWNPFLPMQDPDIGVKSVESVKFTTAYTVSGTVALVLGKPLATLVLPQADICAEKDFVFQSGGLERIYDGACLMFLVYMSGGTFTPIMTGELEFVWG